MLEWVIRFEGKWCELESVRLLKSVSEDFIGIKDSQGRKLQGMAGSRSHAELSLTPCPQESESVSDEAPSDHLLLAILAYLLCCPLGTAALYYSSQVGIVSVLTLPSLSLLALTLKSISSMFSILLAQTPP